MTGQVSDVNNLFQTCGIDDIKIVERKIRGEIEKKKEDLRVMVGERYRDLINSADTIQDMKKGSNEILSGITSLNSLCLGFGEKNEPSDDTVQKSGSKEKAFYSLATQMDLLVDTPERIWSCLDTHQYLLAAKLYLLSKHIVNSSLNIQSGQSRRGTSRDVFSSFPILHHQWAAISHFKPSILNGARASLKEATLPDQSLAESLCCISLLDNLSPRQIFMEFLMGRKAAIQDVFHPSSHSTSVKKQVCDITHIVQLTIQQMMTLFYIDENQEKIGNKSLFYKILHDATSEKSEDNTSSVFQSLYGEDVNVLTVSRYLPRNVSGFVPKLQNVPVSISVSYIQKHAKEWFDGCIKDVHHGVKNLLSFISNIKGLATMRDAVYDLLRSPTTKVSAESDLLLSWNECCQICLNQPLSIWDQFFRPLFIERTRSLLEKQFKSCFQTLLDALQSDVLKKMEESKNSLDESSWDHDVSSFIWHEFPQELILLMDPVVQSNTEDILLLKTKYYTISIKRLCNQFNNNLHAILQDVHRFIRENEDKDTDIYSDEERRLKQIKKDVQRLIFESDDDIDGGSITEPFEKFADCIHVQEIMATVFTSEVKALCSDIRATLDIIQEKITNLKDGTVPVVALINQATYLSRFCLSVPDLCYNILQIVDYKLGSSKPQLRRELSKQLTHKHALKKSENLLRIEEEFNSNTLHGFSIWTKWVCKMSIESMKTILNSSNNFPLFATTNWELIAIEEENEKGEKLKSHIKVPSQISFYLSSLLHNTSEEYHRVGAGVLDRTSAMKLSLGIGSSIHEAHSEFLSTIKDGCLYQNQALQMIFDVKFINKLFCGNADNKTKDVVQFRKSGIKIIKDLERFIDPFDLDVFMPHISTFVQRYLQRTALIFGSISFTDKISSGQSPSLSTTNPEEHSVLQMLNNPPRFMLLPLSSHYTKSAKENQKICMKTEDLPSPLFHHQRQITIQGMV